MKTLTTLDFVSKAKAVHGDRYDYSSTNYVNSKTKVTICCAEHGTFDQTPANHLTGFGCLRCGFKNAGQYHKKDTNSFIAEARAIHGEKYDYSQTQYRGAREKLTIVCPRHGPFDQVAHVHLRGEFGAECERCSYETRGDRARMGFGEFMRRSNLVHHNAYDYSAAEPIFVDSASKIPIFCAQHGVFDQTPGNHLAGQGCPKCGVAKTGDAMRKLNTTFIEEAAAVHSGKYDYSKTEYAGAFNSVNIICALDGEFTQTPTSHLAGIGCPRCSRRGQGAPRNLTRALRGEFDGITNAFVYVVKFRLPCSDLELCKVGSGTGTRIQTVRNDIQRVGGSRIEIWHQQFTSSGEAIVFEHLAHNQVLEHQFIVPPEFKFHGLTEVFVKTPNLQLVEIHPVLSRFRSGERWDPRSEAA